MLNFIKRKKGSVWTAYAHSHAVIRMAIRLSDSDGWPSRAKRHLALAVMAQKQFFAIGKGKSGATVMQIAPNNVQRSDASIDIICITGRVKNYSKKNKNKKKCDSALVGPFPLLKKLRPILEPVLKQVFIK
jgi:hypothetical protein